MDNIDLYIFATGASVSVLLLVFYEKLVQRNFDFVVTGIICSAFLSCHISPYFGIIASTQTFGILGASVVILGGFVGGVLGVLIPKIVKGVLIGVLVAFPAIVLTTMVVSTSIAGPIILAALIIGGICIAHKLEGVCTVVLSGLVVGLLFALSTDRLCLGHPLANELKSLFLMNFDNIKMSQVYSGRDLVLLGLCAWGIIFLIHVVVHRKYSLRNGQKSSQGPPQDPGFAKQQTFTFHDSSVDNLFNVDSLPEMLTPFSNSVFSTGHALNALYGFQLDSSKNQTEHLLMMLTNEVSSSDKSSLLGPTTRLHNKMFSNYQLWCKRMGVSCLLEKLDCLSLIGVGATQSDIKNLGVGASSDVNRTKANRLIADMLLFLLIWGEAGNLKHLPECLCFLFHKTIESRIRFSQKHVYPGYYLDMVVSPLYDVVATGLSAKGDHNNRKTYDDFNEFFWAPQCLVHSIVDAGSSFVGDSELDGGKSYNQERGTKALAASLKGYSKTYVEKRSWLHPLLSMHRIFEWHLITFTLLATWAFANVLIWDYSYTWKIGSFMFWEITFLSIIWTCLEVWTLFPNAAIHDASKFGYVIRLLTGFLVLVYQSMYYNWSFSRESFVPANVLRAHAGTELHSSLRSEGDENFWWWQYIWLSLFASSIYILESFLCWFPGVGTAILTWDNGVVQACLNILYPLTQMYVGKRTSVPQKDVVGYIFYWITLIGFKLWFGYQFLILPVTFPSLQLFDDYMNYGFSFSKTAVLLFLWWCPHYLVYLIDLSIWYSVWSSLAGGLMALIDRQGEVRDLSSVRLHFSRCPQAFCQKIQSVSSVRLPRGVAASSANLVGLLQSSNFAKTASKQADGAMDSPRSLRSGISTALAQWQTAFAKIWNEIILRLREVDLLKNEERDNFMFSTFPWLSKPVYLPLFQTAGCIDAATSAYQSAATEFQAESVPANKINVAEKFYSTIATNSIREAVEETWELSGWILTTLLGRQHEKEIFTVLNVLETWSNSSTGEILSKVDSSKLPMLLRALSGMVDALLDGYDKRQRNPVVHASVLLQMEQFEKNEESKADDNGKKTPETGLRKSNSSGFLLALDPQSVIHSTKKPSSQTLTKDASQDKFSSGRYEKIRPFRAAFHLPDNCRDKVREELRSCLGSLKGALQQKSGESSDVRNVLHSIGVILSSEVGFMFSDVYASTNIDNFVKDPRTLRALKKLAGLLKLRRTECDSISREAIRRMTFFVNSLFMDMPAVASTRFSKEFTVMTPYYGEDVLLSKKDLEEKNSDGITTMLYLQSLYVEDWKAFLQRREIDESKMWTPQHIMHTRMWASMRAQTLYRTVEGMMHSDAAIRLICELESVSEEDSSTLAKLKFNYVVACQIYGQLKKRQDSKAEDIEFLLQRFPNLRVAYIDSFRDGVSRDVSFFSVLIKHDPVTQKCQEVYRIKLAGNPVLGEGKPENQNHAIIFSRGRYLQAVDMNQDGYFEEALKMRNLLEEFNDGYSILGFREHIFTGSVSSVANYMALQELSFVTLGQRVLARPLRIRQHYGHPDFFDKMFVMTEGGMSKASKGINLSEDVFAGFNATLRGKTIGFKEYAQVGKGRDVGLQQTYKFEAKLSQGNAEQSLSRDLSRICDRLDFFRLMSFYYGGIGHYMANTMVMFTLVVVVYIMLGLSIYGQEGVNGRPLQPEGVLELLLAGMGILQTLPLAVTLIVENGLKSAFVEISYMILSGGPLYFIFHIQTKCYYFQQTLMAGGAKYQPTGRGFVIRHSPFDENFRFFAASHIYLGFELMVALFLLSLTTMSKQYAGLTWSLWLTVSAFLLGPFWFNPLSFQIDRLREDYGLWQRWMAETVGSTDQSWYSWWMEENSFFKDLSFSWKVLLFFQKCGIWALLSAGLLGSRILRDHDERVALGYFVLTILVFSFISWLLSKFERSLPYPIRRMTSITLSLSVLGALLYQLINHSRLFRYVIGLYYMMASISFVFLLLGYQRRIAPIYKIHDNVVGFTLFVVLSVLTLLQLGRLQTSLLYYDALSNGVVLNDMMKQMQTQKNRAGDENEEVLSLRKEVREQKELLAQQMESFKKIMTGPFKGYFNGQDINNYDDGVEISERHSLLSRSPKDGSSGYGSVAAATTTSSSNPLTISIDPHTAQAGVVNALSARSPYGSTLSPVALDISPSTLSPAHPSVYYQANGLFQVTGGPVQPSVRPPSNLPTTIASLSSSARGNMVMNIAAKRGESKAQQQQQQLHQQQANNPHMIYSASDTAISNAPNAKEKDSSTPTTPVVTTHSALAFPFKSPADLPPR